MPIYHIELSFNNTSDVRLSNQQLHTSGMWYNTKNLLTEKIVTEHVK